MRVVALVMLATVPLVMLEVLLVTPALSDAVLSDLVESDAVLIFSAMQLYQDFQILISHQQTVFTTQETISRCCY